MNIERLDSLSTEALYTLSEKMNLDLPPDLERVFVLEALMEAFDEDNEDRNDARNAAVYIESTKFSGTELDEIDASLDAAPSIENRYNETSINVIVRDPEWAFVFWDIRDYEYENLTSIRGFSNFLLRVWEIKSAKDGENESFDVVVGETDDSWYLHVPNPDSVYRVDLYACFDTKYQLLAQSHAVRTPKMYIEDSLSDMNKAQAELLKLSKVEELEIINNSVDLY